ncbi:hypothetical protein Pla100_22420 [Neorhodopirellula pilleata]|uniref:Uncharacterized protein n=1 Tax=Neorhodopirellula pilleata TaxID=2714738 RepID=A0A5C6AI38_9BACT|nr:hypothetical protein Pla100_22420 [Neorhodopirellula pilleata]
MKFFNTFYGSASAWPLVIVNLFCFLLAAATTAGCSNTKACRIVVRLNPVQMQRAETIERVRVVNNQIVHSSAKDLAKLERNSIVEMPSSIDDSYDCFVVVELRDSNGPTQHEVYHILSNSLQTMERESKWLDPIYIADPSADIAFRTSEVCRLSSFASKARTQLKFEQD